MSFLVFKVSFCLQMIFRLERRSCKGENRPMRKLEAYCWEEPNVFHSVLLCFRLSFDIFNSFVLCMWLSVSNRTIYKNRQLQVASWSIGKKCSLLAGQKWSKVKSEEKVSIRKNTIFICRPMIL